MTNTNKNNEVPPQRRAPVYSRGDPKGRPAPSRRPISPDDRAMFPRRPIFPNNRPVASDGYPTLSIGRPAPPAGHPLVSDSQPATPHRYRIGVSVQDADWYWEQVYSGITQRASELDLDMISFDQINVGPSTLPGEELVDWLEQQPIHDFDALIIISVVIPAWYRILDHGLPIIALTETHLRHPFLITPQGLFEIAQQLGSYVAQQLSGKGTVLVVGGMTDIGEAGRSRLAGLRHAFQSYPAIRMLHVPSVWGYEHAYAQAYPRLLQYNTHIDAIIGLTDPIALGARDAAATLDLLHNNTIVVGLGGYPESMAALSAGSMHATVDLFPHHFGQQAIELAVQVVQKQPVPDYFHYQGRLITYHDLLRQSTLPLPSLSANTTSLEKHNHRRMDQREIDKIINYLNSMILDHRLLMHGIAALIRVNYGYDHVQIVRWLPEEHALLLEQVHHEQPTQLRIPISEANILAQAVLHRLFIFVPDLQHSDLFPPDPRWPRTRTRIAIPIYLGDTILGLIDLHCYHIRQHTFSDLQQIEHVAERLALSLRSADLYHEAVQARTQALEAQARAEQADHLKTRLLANVSHEFRTPLHAILNSVQASLADPDPSPLRHNLQQVARHAEHLARLVNDLLDLSRAEIDELPLAPELIPTRPFLEEVFHSLADGQVGQSAVSWELHLPERLPMIEADPLRLRQVLFNLLDNARKFTSHGRIVLGAELAPPRLHLWVQDSGIGIPPDQQQRIFEPFVTADQTRRRPEGVGLGLSIVRRLIALHHGTLQLDSQPGLGSTFHIYLPLPSLSGQLPAVQTQEHEPVLLFISTQKRPTPAILELCQRQNLRPLPFHPQDDLDTIWTTLRPQVIAWDVTAATPRDWSLIDQLRQHAHLSGLPFILYSQEDENASRQPVGITNLLTKPVDHHTLASMIASMAASDTTGSILIVDDDSQTCNLYQHLAQQAFPDYTIHIAQNGAAALHLLATVVPSLVILDLTMPDVDGFVVLDRLRAARQTRKVPVLVLSGRTLTFDDVQRLNHASVIFQSKDLLPPEEMTTLFQRSLSGSPLVPQTSLLIKQFIAYLHHHYARNLSIQDIAAAIGVSERHLSRIVQQELGMTPWEYLSRYRIKQARTLLRDTSASITTIATQVGFEDPSYFSRVFRQHTGHTPSEYREQAP